MHENLTRWKFATCFRTPTLSFICPRIVLKLSVYISKIPYYGCLLEHWLLRYTEHRAWITSKCTDTSITSPWPTYHWNFATLKIDNTEMLLWNKRKTYLPCQVTAKVAIEFSVKFKSEQSHSESMPKIYFV